MKGLDPQEKNYCPVSNLPFFSKLVEHATLMQFDKHCREHHLLPDFQSVYRKGYSTKNITNEDDKQYILEYGEKTSNSGDSAQHVGNL